MSMPAVETGHEVQAGSMYSSPSSKWLGLLYLTPALLFVAVFTIYPLGQMIWVSFNNWTLISPPKYVGFNNFTKAFSDRQFWISLTFTLKYTLLITPILMIGGYAIALLVAGNSPLQRFTRTVVFLPVVIGLGAMLTKGISARIGYNVIIWNDVMRVSDALPPGLAVDPRNLPPVQAGGGQDPRFAGICGSNFIAHGITAGVEWAF